jgi:hypothetical protein
MDSTAVAGSGRKNETLLAAGVAAGRPIRELIA